MQGRDITHLQCLPVQMSLSLTHQTSPSGNFVFLRIRRNQIICKHIFHCCCHCCCCCCCCSACDDLLTNLRPIKTRKLFATRLNESRRCFYLVNCSICLSDCMTNVNEFSYSTYNCYNHCKYVCTCGILSMNALSNKTN